MGAPTKEEINGGRGKCGRQIYLGGQSATEIKEEKNGRRGAEITYRKRKRWSSNHPGAYRMQVLSQQISRGVQTACGPSEAFTLTRHLPTPRPK